MLYLLLLLNPALAAVIEDESSATLSEWISILVSRGIYVLLASLIALCFIVTTVRNKLDERATQNRGTGSESSWTNAFWKGANPYLSIPAARFNQRNFISSDIDSSDYDILNDRLKEADVTITSLKSELDLANKGKIDLENTLELFERQKMGSEDELLRVKIDGALELEALKKEAGITERHLQIALEERNDLAREVECLKREGRITQSALRDQMNLTERLEKARVEIDGLKLRMRDMKAERDLAVRLASDMIEKAKGVATRDNEQRLVIEKMIEDEVKRIRLEEEERDNELKMDMNEMELKMNPSEPYSAQLLGNGEPKHPHFKPGSPKKQERAYVLTESDLTDMDQPIGDSRLSIRGDQHIVVATIPNQECYSAEDIIDSTLSSQISFTSTDFMDDEMMDEKNRLVTGSPAFRAFLSSLSHSNNS